MTDQAMVELEDNRNTEDLNTSINLVCLAVRQLDLVSDSTPSVSRRFYGYAKGLFRSEQDYLAELNKLELPPEVDNLVSGSFVDDLVGGDSYDACLLAAKNAKIKTVLVPKENKPDIREISNEITGDLNILYMESMDEVLEQALGGQS